MAVLCIAEDELLISDLPLPEKQNRKTQAKPTKQNPDPMFLPAYLFIQFLHSWEVTEQCSVLMSFHKEKQKKQTVTDFSKCVPQ